MEEYFWYPTLPSMGRIRKLLKKSNSFEEFKVLLEKEFGSKLVVNYGLESLEKEKRGDD